MGQQPGKGQKEELRKEDGEDRGAPRASRYHRTSAEAAREGTGRLQHLRRESSGERLGDRRGRQVATDGKGPLALAHTAR